MESIQDIDRPIDPGVIRQRRNKKLLRWLLILVAGIITFYLFYGWIRPSVDRDSLRTAVVEMGRVEATITAAGVVLPDNEQVITAPFDTRIVSILKHAGDKVFKDDPILVLDTSEAHLTLERISDNLKVKETERTQQALELKMSQNDLVTRRAIKKLLEELSAAKVQQQRELFRLGGTSKELVTQAELEEEIAVIELQHLDSLTSGNEIVTEAKLANLETEIALLRKEQNEMRRLLLMATTRADHEAVVTWVVDQVGTALHKSDQIARTSDLSSYRVEATVSDVHAGNLLPGMPVHVRINDTILEGTISTINPTIQNGVITLSVALTNPSDPRLHSHLRVDVYIVTSERTLAMRIKRGQITESVGNQPLFVLRGSSAIRADVKIGLVGYDFAEILGGLELGDTVITSNMTEHNHLSKIRIN